MLEKQVIDVCKMCEVNKFRPNGNPTEKQLRAGNTAERVKTEAGGSRRPVWGRGGESATVRPPGARGSEGQARNGEKKRGDAPDAKRQEAPGRPAPLKAEGWTGGPHAASPTIQGQ